MKLSPGTLALIAVLSIGGLVLLGFEANLVGKAYDVPYTACCTLQSWSHAPTGFVQGEAFTFTAVCNSGESIARCCLMSSPGQPVQVLGAKLGACNNYPEQNYPVWIR